MKILKMNVIRKICKNCDGDYEAGCNSCPNCDNCLNTKIKKYIDKKDRSLVKEESDFTTLVKSDIKHDAMQIVSAGIRSDNIYEAKVLLASEVELSSIKITVKEKNLRVTVYRSFCEDDLTEISAKYGSLNAMKAATKHCVNFLVPNTIIGDKFRAIVDDKHKLLILTAPPIKSTKIKQ